jgi:hypothetical protein
MNNEPNNEPNKEKILKFFPDGEFYTLDGFDEAIIGIASQAGQSFLVVYSDPKIIEILTKRDGMTLEEAVEYAEFNIFRAYFGEKTPIIMTSMEDMNEF